jgi:multicomponent Na+:H+ antiporter subunit G
VSEALEVASWVLLSLGAVFCVIGALGVLRMPDFYSRTHPATMVDTLGAGLILAGLALQVDGEYLIAVKLAMIFVFILISSPTAAHALVKGAYAHGIEVEMPVEDRTGDRAD